MGPLSSAPALVRSGNGAATWERSVGRDSNPSRSANDVALVSAQMNRGRPVFGDKSPSRAKILDPHSRDQVPSAMWEQRSDEDLSAFADRHLRFIAESLVGGGLPNYNTMRDYAPVEHSMVLAAIAGMDAAELVKKLNEYVSAKTSGITIHASDAKTFGCELVEDSVVYLKAIYRNSGGVRPFAITDNGCMVHPGASVALESS